VVGKWAPIAESGSAGLTEYFISENGDVSFRTEEQFKRFESEPNFVLQLNGGKQIVVKIRVIGATRESTAPVVIANPTGEEIKGEISEETYEYSYEFEGTPSQTLKRYFDRAFPVYGQPDGVVVDAEPNTDYGGTRFGSTVAKVPGQGVWKIQNSDNGGTITFTPEPGFTGDPIYPRVGAVDVLNMNHIAYAQSVFGDQEPNIVLGGYPNDIERFNFIDARYVVPKKYQNEAEENPDFNPNTPPPAEDLHVTDVKKDDKGDYVVTRSDGESWTIELKDIRDKIAELDKKDAVSPDDLAEVKDDLDKKIKDITDKVGPLEDAVNDNTDAIKDLRDDLNDLEDRVDGLEDRIDALENAVIKEVRDNGDGTYTLIRKDNSEVKGNIDTSGSVTNIKTDGKGNLIVTIDGKDKKVPLDQIKITESNKGTPDHTVTITTPDGQSVTFNVFDNYVMDVKREKDGNYKVVRNDGTEWVINLKDIRDKIAALEAKESPSRDEFNKVKDEIDNLKKEIDGLKATDKKLEDGIANIKNDITNLDIRIIKIESRLTAVEDRTDALTKCVAGAGAAGIPALLSIPLMVMTQLNIPGIKDLNTQIQKQIGMYNPELARRWERNGGVLQAGAVLAGLAGMIGSIAYIANQCDPMMKTPAGQETDLGKLSSKLDEKGLGSSQKEKDAEATQPGEQEAPAKDAPVDADVEALAVGAAEAAEPEVTLE